MSNKIVVMKWGEVYTQEHIDKMFDQVNANCSVPFDFVPLIDVDIPKWNAAQKIHFRGQDDPDQRAEGKWDDFERDDCGGLTHYRKLLMFKEDLDLKVDNKPVFDPDDTILYLDLDSLILGDLSYFFDLDNEKPWLVKSYWFDENEGEEWKRQFHLRRCPYFNSSVMVWKPGQNRRIFDFVNENLDKVFFTYGANDNFMFHAFGPYAYEQERREHFNMFPMGIITSEEYPRYGRGLVHMLNGLSIDEKNALCL